MDSFICQMWRLCGKMGYQFSISYYITCSCLGLLTGREQATGRVQRVRQAALRLDPRHPGGSAEQEGPVDAGRVPGCPGRDEPHQERAGPAAAQGQAHLRAFVAWNRGQYLPLFHFLNCNITRFEELPFFYNGLETSKESSWLWIATDYRRECVSKIDKRSELR